LRGGFDVVSEAIRLNERVTAADVVITGEGRLDEQTREGKAPGGVAMLARAAGKRVFAIVGAEEINARELFEAVFVLARAPISRAQAVERAAELLQERARELAHSL
jgi:glycerate kinase